MAGGSGWRRRGRICRIPHTRRAAGQNAPAPGRGARGEARWPSRHRGRGQWAEQRRGDGERRRAGSRAFQSSIGAPCPLLMQRRGAEQSWAAGRGSFRAVRPSGSADFQLLSLPPSPIPGAGTGGKGNQATGGGKSPTAPPAGRLSRLSALPAVQIFSSCPCPRPTPGAGTGEQGKPGDRRGQVPHCSPRRATFRAVRPSGSADFQLLPLPPGLSPAPGQEGEGNWAIGGSKFPLVPPPGGFPSSPLREVCGPHAPLPRQG